LHLLEEQDSLSGVHRLLVSEIFIDLLLERNLELAYKASVV
jgi:hypothetical protein